MLFIFFGTRIFGRVDVVPRTFHVATEFFHIMLLPLIPLQSWVVVEQKGMILPEFRGARIPLVWKSVVAGWIRAWSGLLAIFAWVGVLTTPADDRLPVLTLAVVFTFLAWLTPALSRASYLRAKAVARLAGPSLDLADGIERAFGRAPPARRPSRHAAAPKAMR